MVVLLDFDAENDEALHAGHDLRQFSIRGKETRHEEHAADSNEEDGVERLNPNVNSFSEALGCYP